MPYLLFLKKEQNFELSSAANYSGALRDNTNILPYLVRSYNLAVVLQDRRIYQVGRVGIFCPIHLSLGLRMTLLLSDNSRLPRVYSHAQIITYVVVE